MIIELDLVQIVSIYPKQTTIQVNRPVIILDRDSKPVERNDKVAKRDKHPANISLSLHNRLAEIRTAVLYHNMTEDHRATNSATVTSTFY